MGRVVAKYRKASLLQDKGDKPHSAVARRSHKHGLGFGEMVDRVAGFQV